MLGNDWDFILKDERTNRTLYRTIQAGKPEK